MNNQRNSHALRPDSTHKSTLVLLTARGGSSLTNKNLRAVMGKPSLYYPITESKKALDFSADFYCSSDDDVILDYAQSQGFKTLKRPKHLAQDTTNHDDVLEHALSTLGSRKYSYLLVLLGNAPVITHYWIQDAVRKLEADSTVSSVIPYVVDQDRHPFRSKTVGLNGILGTHFSKNQNLPGNRQSLSKAAFPAHNFWLLRLDSGKLVHDGEAPWPFFGKKTLGIELPVSICDIHDEIDIVRIELEWGKWNRNNLYNQVKNEKI